MPTTRAALTTLDRDEYVYEALRAGSSGFLLKDAPEDQLVAAIRVAAGLSNADIAAALVVSEHTAKTHIAHILAKLGLRGRTQAVIFAYEAGVVRPGD